MLLTLEELANEAGLSVETILHYQAEGLIQPLAIVSSHRYGQDAQLKLKLICKAKRLGFTLAEVRKLLELEQLAATPPHDD